MTETPENPDQIFLNQLLSEVVDLTGHELTEHEELIAMIAGELALSEVLQRQAEQDIAAAKEMAAKNRQKVGEKTKLTLSVDMARIGWINGEEKVDLPAQKITTENMEYDFVDLTELSRPTKDLKERLERQKDKDGISIASKLTESVKTNGIPNLSANIKQGHGKQLRPVSIGNRRKKDVTAEQSLNTSYTAYKINVQGTNNRAIVISFGENKTGRPAFGLAILYDHVDETRVHNTGVLFLKHK